MNAREKVVQIKKKKLSAVENIQQFLAVIERKNPKINAILQVNPNAIKEAEAVDKKIKLGKGGKLAGLGIVVKSNISVIGLEVSCASKTLEGYRGTFDADVIKKIKAEDGIILGMGNCDEFACGATGEFSAFGPTDNPVAQGYISGGSSSGSAAAVAAGMCDIALGSDTGGSIRNPACYCGVVGVKPSYGRVSRYGLVDMAMSLDQIGPLAKTVDDAALLLGVIAGKSEYDGTSSDTSVPNYTKDQGHIRIGIAPAFIELCEEQKIVDLLNETVKQLSEVLGEQPKKITFRHVNVGIQTYYPIVYVEFFSGTRKFDGRKYGKRIEESCREEVLRRILGGKEISKAEHEGAYYRKALAMRKKIQQEFMEAFKHTEVILCPVVPKLPHKIGADLSDPKKVIYAYDVLSVLANLSYICAASVPMGKIDGIPMGIQVLAAPWKEQAMFTIMRKIEELRKEHV